MVDVGSFVFVFVFLLLLDGTTDANSIVEGDVVVWVRGSGDCSDFCVTVKALQ
jgi:hypothetical protein